MAVAIKSSQGGVFQVDSWVRRIRCARSAIRPVDKHTGIWLTSGLVQGEKRHGAGGEGCLALRRGGGLRELRGVRPAAYAEEGLSLAVALLAEIEFPYAAVDVGTDEKR